MNCYEPDFCIIGLDGAEYIMSDKELYETILIDCNSGNNFFASTSELVKTCNEPKFSHGFAIAIKLAILSRFSKLIIDGMDLNNIEMAVYECYNSFNGNYTVSLTQSIDVIKFNFMKSIITNVALYSQTHMLCDEKEKIAKYREEWIRKMCSEFSVKDYMEFIPLIPYLKVEYAKQLNIDK